MVNNGIIYLPKNSGFLEKLSGSAAFTFTISNGTSSYSYTVEKKDYTVGADYISVIVHQTTA